MKIIIDDKFGAVGNKLKKWASDIFIEARKKLNVEALKLEIQYVEQPGSLDDIAGVAGFCPSKEYIRLRVDTSSSKFDKESFQLSLAHEIHHAARRQQGVAIGESTFLECLISEGLADKFCKELLGKLPVWSIKLPMARLEKLENKASKLYKQDMTDKLYHQWFLVGDESAGIPKWAGYALGYYLVNKSNITNQVSL